MNVNNNTIKLNSTGQYDDMQGNFLQGLASAALTQIQYRDTGFYMLATRHDQPDELSFVFQVPHRWKRDTALHFHIHYIPMSTWTPTPNTKNIYIEYQYAFAKFGEVLPAVSTWSSIAYHTEQVGYDDQYKHKLMDIFDFTPTGAKESEMLLVRIKSLGGNGSYTYTDDRSGTGEQRANVAVLYADVHFESEKLGTSTEIPV